MTIDWDIISVTVLVQAILAAFWKLRAITITQITNSVDAKIEHLKSWSLEHFVRRSDKQESD